MRTTASRYTLLIGTVLLAMGSIVACSGGGGGGSGTPRTSGAAPANPGAASSSQQTAKTTLSISIPNNGQLALTNRRAAQSMFASASIVVRYVIDTNPANAPTNPFDFPANSTIATGTPVNISTGAGGNCTTANSTLNCTVPVTLPIGVLDIYVLDYDTANGTGSLMYGSVTTLQFNAAGTFSAATPSGPSTLNPLQANPLCGAPTPTPGPTGSSNLVYTANGQNQIVAFPLNTGGNIAPVKTIGGSQSGLENGITAIAFDTTGNLYVAANPPYHSALQPTIEVFAPGSNGNVPPMRVIDNNSGGVTPAIALDAAGFLYLSVDEGATGNTSLIVVYPPGANGNASPARTIQTACYTAEGIAVTPAGRVSLECSPVAYPDYSPEIVTYAPGASGNATPISTIAGSNAKLGAANGLGLTPSGNILVASNSTNCCLLEFASNANGNVSPVADISGSATALDAPISVVTSSDGTTFTVNSQYVNDGNSSIGFITEYAATANGNSAPIYTIEGSNTELTPPNTSILAIGPP